MQMVSRTIDNLGYDASERYAQDQKLLDGHEKTSTDSRIIFSKTSIEVTKPLTESEIDLISQASRKNNAWAEFQPPPGYEQQKRFFTHELIPEFGNKEKVEKLKEKIVKLCEEKESGSDSQDEQKEEWQIIKEKEAEEKEKQILMNLLNCILHLDTCIIYVHTKRAQYHKG